jgi:ATP-dependent RNA helicase RhlE
LLVVLAKTAALAYVTRKSPGVSDRAVIAEAPARSVELRVTWLNGAKELHGLTFQDFDFDPRLQAGIAAQGYTQPTPIQQAAMPEVLARRDVLGVAQTGTGKTAAFMLPILQNLLDGPRGVARALVLAPTRELAEQIHQATRGFAEHTKLKTATVYGGVSKNLQAQKLRRGVDVVVACPGRLLDVYEDGDLDLSQIETVVLDEADRMFDMGFLPDVRRILNLLPTRRQNLFFSATMPPEIRRLADGILVAPALVTIDAQAPAATISHAFYPVTEPLKNSLLVALLKDRGRQRTLVFTRTKYRARNLTKVLGFQGHRVMVLEGNMTQSKRQAAIDGFRKGRYDVLVATDVAARGIDVTGIETVINYDMPETFESYTHRVGRTGRAERTGEAVNLAAVSDTPLVQEIEDQQGGPLDERVIEGFDYGTFTPRLILGRPKPVKRSGGGLGHRRARTASRRRTARSA